MIKNKRIWITGASSGIGSELAQQLAAMGNTVVVSARSEDKLQLLAAGESSGRILPLVYDVTVDDASDEIRDNLNQLVDALDIVILCAGRCEYVDNAVLETDMFRRVFEVNVFGSVNATVVALPLLEVAATQNIEEKPQLVVLSSLSTVTGLPRAEAYGSSKAAMTYLFNTLRLDLKQRIDVTVVNPGFVATPMTKQNDFPMPFMMQPPAAALQIIKGIAKRKLTVNFPWRLWLSLKLPSLSSNLWYRVIGPRLARNEPSQ